jgi:hypothetical protein
MAGSPVTRLAPDLPAGPRAALIIAITSYQDLDLRQLRAPAHDAEDLAEVLSDPDIGAFAVTRVIDQDDQQVRREIDAFLSARGPGDLVVVYLSCHGVLDRRNRLYFATADTRKTQLASTGIASAWLLEQLEECRARRQVLVLDCCFSGAFAHGSKGDTDLDLERRLTGQGRGRAVLTASRAGEYSFEGQALPGAAVAGSVFTAGLVEGLRTGAADTGSDGYISLDEAYDYAYDYVQSSGASQTPQRWLYGGEGTIVLARSPAGIAITPAKLPEALAASLDNPYPSVRIAAVSTLGGWLAGDDPALALTAEQKLRHIAHTDIPAVADAARACLLSCESAAAVTNVHIHDARLDGNTLGETAQKPLESVQRDQARAVQVLVDAERVANSITEKYQRAQALADIAGAMAAIDLAHAERLADEAERIANSIGEPDTGKSVKAGALAEIAEKLAAIDPDRAEQLFAEVERIANSMIDKSSATHTLADIAEKMAAIDPGGAERIANSLSGEFYKRWTRADIAEKMAAIDPARAERIANSITDEAHREHALADVARALATTDPDRAERIANSLTRGREDTLADIARTLATTNPDGAERIANSMEYTRARALADVARALAATNPDRAERIANSLTREGQKVKVLADIAGKLAASDPDRAARVADNAERFANSVGPKSAKAQALAEIAETLATADPDRAARLADNAERIANSFAGKWGKARALAMIAETLAVSDPDRAARLADNAESVAQPVTGKALLRLPWSKEQKEWPLRCIAAALASTDPDRAERFANSITDKDQKEEMLNYIAGKPAWIAEKLAATNPDRAERFANSISNQKKKELVCIAIVEVLAATDPDRAERIAHSITNEEEKVKALVRIAEA